MEYLSTRGEDNKTTFEGVLLKGLAETVVYICQKLANI
ncbi:MAG: hypothetical protein CM15mP117_05010 [Alphaproteobacteria bacterium]|nr:MAG: hypothetical protein CM15mP117_05010 [Alphaproteobacteria bacterium]